MAATAVPGAARAAMAVTKAAAARAEEVMVAARQVDQMEDAQLGALVEVAAMEAAEPVAVVALRVGAVMSVLAGMVEAQMAAVRAEVASKVVVRRARREGIVHPELPVPPPARADPPGKTRHRCQARAVSSSPGRAAARLMHSLACSCRPHLSSRA